MTTNATNALPDNEVPITAGFVPTDDEVARTGPSRAELLDNIPQFPCWVGIMLAARNSRRVFPLNYVALLGEATHEQQGGLLNPERINQLIDLWKKEKPKYLTSCLYQSVDDGSNDSDLVRELALKADSIRSLIPSTALAILFAEAIATAGRRDPELADVPLAMVRGKRSSINLWAACHHAVHMRGDPASRKQYISKVLEECLGIMTTEKPLPASSRKDRAKDIGIAARAFFADLRRAAELVAAEGLNDDSACSVDKFGALWPEDVTPSWWPSKAQPYMPPGLR